MPFRTRILLPILLLSIALLAACAPQPIAAAPSGPALTQTFDAALTLAVQSFPTATATPTITSTPEPTSTPTLPPPTPTVPRTPSPLPPVFTSSILSTEAQPRTFIEDTCQYLKARWNPNTRAPGTVVMVLMYHSITEDYNPITYDSQVHHSDLVMTLEHAHEVGFETITAGQLADFLDTNARIPRRSLLLIVDDRKRKEFYEEHFGKYLDMWGWKITNAWISAKDTPEYLWQENQEIVRKGWVDVQAHGVVHNTPIGPYSSDEYINGELIGSIEAIEKYHGTRPVGFIWPGGGFTKRAVELAREAGYRVGFTTNPRGPIMYNWVPQADEVSPAHPLWLPETSAGDARMTLPRYWSNDAAYRIDDVIAIGDAAIAEAEKTRAAELDYYDVMCVPKLGPIPTLIP